MDQFKPRTTLGPSPRETVTEYLFDMIQQLAVLARETGELQVAIHLEAIIAAQRAIAKDPSA